MTEQIPEISEKPIQPEVVSEIPVKMPKKNNVPKIILFVILGLIIVAGAIYAGMQIGKKQTPIVLPTAPPQNIRPTDVFPTSTPDETGSWKLI